MSVFFYFKSSEESGRFYLNSYEFTKDVSEILGRIEAGFGERLKHLDEGYSAMTRRVDDVLSEKGKMEKEIESEEVELNETKQEREEIINSLFEKVNATEDEKQEMRKSLADKEKELDYAKRQISRLRMQVKNLENEMSPVSVELPPDLHQALVLLSKIIEPRHFVQAPVSWLNRRIKDAVLELSEEARSSMIEHDVLSKDNKLTNSGRKLLHDFGEELTNR